MSRSLWKLASKIEKMKKRSEERKKKERNSLPGYHLFLSHRQFFNIEKLKEPIFGNQNRLMSLGSMEVLIALSRALECYIKRRIVTYRV